MRTKHWIVALAVVAALGVAGGLYVSQGEGQPAVMGSGSESSGSGSGSGSGSAGGASETAGFAVASEGDATLDATNDAGGSGSSSGSSSSSSGSASLPQ